MVGEGGENTGYRRVDGGILEFSVSEMALFWVIMRSGVHCRSR